jgi:hypothetical protein
VNHRIFERTLRPLVFLRACLFERHLTLQAMLGVGRLSRLGRGLALKTLAACVLASSAADSRLRPSTLVFQQVLLPNFDLGSGRDTR